MAVSSSSCSRFPGGGRKALIRLWVNFTGTPHTGLAWDDSGTIGNVFPGLTVSRLSESFMGQTQQGQGFVYLCLPMSSRDGPLSLIGDLQSGFVMERHGQT